MAPTRASPALENQTAMERIVGAIPLPYSVSCIFLASLTGPPLQFLVFLIDTGSLDQAFYFTFNIAGTTFGPTQITTEVGILSQSLWFLSLAFLYYMPRFVRTRLLSYEPLLIPISPSGEETLHRDFGGVTKLLPAVLLSLVMGLLSVPYTYFQASYVSGLGTDFFLVFTSVMTSFLFGTFVWIYFRSLWGLYKLGKESLHLKPYSEDPMLGAKPIGSMSFTLFLSYFIAVVLSGIGVFFTGDPVGIGGLLLLSLLGGIMFFLSVNSVHARMAAEKQREKKSVLVDLVNLGASSRNSSDSNDVLQTIKDLQFLKLRKDYVSAIPTWPFDTGVLGRFAAIILSVTAILLSRVITVRLGI